MMLHSIRCRLKIRFYSKCEQKVFRIFLSAKTYTVYCTSFSSFQWLEKVGRQVELYRDGTFFEVLKVASNYRILLLVIQTKQ